MSLNVKYCLLCGELHAGNLRVAGYEICAACEQALLGRRISHKTLRSMRRLAVKACLTIS